MNALYNFAVGPLAWIAFTVCIGGMIWRLWSLGRLARQRDASALAYMNWKDSLTSIIRWTLPFSTCGWRENPLLTVANFVLHIGILLAVLIATMMIPAMALLIPVYKLLGSMGLVNSYLGIIIPRMADVGGIFLLRQFFISIPKDLDNAARIDGAGEFRIFAQIILPNAVPAILTVGMFNFMGNWNDLLWPLIMTSKPETRTITAGLAMLTGHGSSVTPYGVVMAGALISALPLLVVFFLVQKRFVEGIAMTGMK